MARIPAPKIINDLKGDTHGRRRHEHEPEPLPGAPEMPEHLDEIAQAKWHEMTGTLSAMNLLSKSDRGMLEAMCVCYSRWRKAIAETQEKGEYVLGKNGFPCHAPWANLVTSLGDQLKKYEDSFGLSPASRSRMRTALAEKTVPSKWEGLHVA